MNIRKIFYAVGLGASFLASSQNIRASVQETQPNKNITQATQTDDPFSIKKSHAEIQNKKLKAILDLLNERDCEVLNNLADLTSFYESLGYNNAFFGEMGPQATEEVRQKRKDLLSQAKDQYQKLFEKFVNQMASPNRETRSVGINNLYALNTVLPGGWSTSVHISSLLDPGNNLDLIFSKILQSPSGDEKALQSYLNLGLNFLRLLQNQPFAERYAQSLNSQIAYALRKENTSKNRDLILEKAVRDLASDLPSGTATNIEKVLFPLLPNYTKLIGRNNPDPDFIAPGIKGFKHFIIMDSKVDPTPKKEVTAGLSSLLNVILEGISKTEEVEEKERFVREVFESMQELNSYPLEKQNYAIDLFSKYFFKPNGENAVDIFHFANYAMPGYGGEFLMFVMSWYMVSNLILNNPEYFEDNCQVLIRNFKEAKTNEEKENAISDLRKLFVFVETAINPRGYQYPSNVSNCPDEKLSKVKTWTKEHIAIPIINTLLEKLAGSKPSIGYTDGEIYVNDDELKLLNDCIEKILGLRPEYCDKLLDTVKKVLEKEGNPYVGERYYETLELISVRTPESLSSKYHNFLLSGIINGSSPQALRGIAYPLSYGIENRLRTSVDQEGKSQGNFLTKLEGDLTKVNIEELSPDERLILTCLRIVSGDTELAKSLLGNRKFPPPEIKIVRGKREVTYPRENIEYGRAFRNLQHNAFLVLAYSASQLPDKKDFFHGYEGQAHHKQRVSTYCDLTTGYKQFIMNFLEEHLQFNVLEFDRLNPEN